MKASLPRQRRYVSIAEAADLVGASTRTVRRRIADGTLTGYRMGPRLVRVDLVQLDSMFLPIPAAEPVEAAEVENPAVSVRDRGRRSEDATPSAKTRLHNPKSSAPYTLGGAE
jgi:excisionase family DNA binding protein